MLLSTWNNNSEILKQSWKSQKQSTNNTLLCVHFPFLPLPPFLPIITLPTSPPFIFIPLPAHLTSFFFFLFPFLLYLKLNCIIYNAIQIIFIYRIGENLLRLHIYPSNFSMRSPYHPIMWLLMIILLLSTIFAWWIEIFICVRRCYKMAVMTDFSRKTTQKQ